MQPKERFEITRGFDGQVQPRKPLSKFAPYGVLYFRIANIHIAHFPELKWGRNTHLKSVYTTCSDYHLLVKYSGYPTYVGSFWWYTFFNNGRVCWEMASNVVDIHSINQCHKCFVGQKPCSSVCADFFVFKRQLSTRNATPLVPSIVRFIFRIMKNNGSHVTTRVLSYIVVGTSIHTHFRWIWDADCFRWKGEARSLVWLCDEWTLLRQIFLREDAAYPGFAFLCSSSNRDSKSEYEECKARHRRKQGSVWRLLKATARLSFSKPLLGEKRLLWRKGPCQIG